MKTLFAALWNYLRRLTADAAAGWNRFWFTPGDPTTLACVRIVVGLVLLYVHVTTGREVLNFIGPEGWIDAQAVREFQEVPDKFFRDATPEMREANTWRPLSLWLWVQNPTAIVILHGVFMLAIVSFILGYRSRLSSVIVWFGQLSYIHRSYTIWFGMDSIMSMLTLYLMFAPTGDAVSVDRLIARYRERRRARQAGEAPGDLPVRWSWSANAVIRLIQLHMCLVYLCSGLAKLQGPAWWGGYATWTTINIPEFALVDMRWLGRMPDGVWQSLTLITTYATLAFEIAFPFIIYSRALRPLTLFMAVALHLGIGLFMGLGAFGCIMLAGCLSFVSPSGLRWFLDALFKGPSGYRYSYDPADVPAARAADFVGAVDVWHQVDLVDSTNTAASGTLVAPDGATYRGGAAGRKLIGPLRVLWLAWPAALWFFSRTAAGGERPSGPPLPTVTAPNRAEATGAGRR
jgi:hypothetical protein